ncbi:MAG: phenylalanine--tRNA ligase subunit beta [Actinobacteria bacterium]|nr:phenylalanine--tRNA ligase subunit beta [Actinomycetota bacterium]
MKVLLSWLRELCPTGLSAEELAELLTRKGAGVEAILRPWEGLSGVVVARVLEVRDHPGSEKLCLARVDTGSGELEVVVGVRNMAAGDLVPLAPPGARVPTLPEPLGRREIRGVVSNGMLCSPRELGVSPEGGAILVLPPDAPVGADFKEAYGLDDAVLDVEVTPNRPDLMSVIGVAREVAAATGVPFTPPDTTVPEGDGKAEDAATVEVLDHERCPRYLARVIRGVAIGPSPLRVQARLTAAGMRPISNVVDATNYVMLEMGQPMHPFDLALLEGSAIVVRRAEEGERIVTLDDVERPLTAEDLLIADRARAVGIAGVMGSAAAEVSDRTTDVLLESAYFAPVGIMRTARRLGLRTEANMRFERGVDPERIPRAADRASRFIAEWSGGTVLAGAVDVGEAPMRRKVSVRPSRASLVLGYEVSREDVQEALSGLGMSVEVSDDGEIVAEVPGYRVDVEREIDLIEEVVRFQGYERVGETLPPVRQTGGYDPEHAFRGRLREALVRAGLRETQTFSFVSEEDLAMMGHPPGGAIRVANPIAADQAYLRTSLVPGLLATLRRNIARQVPGAALFEVGRAFFTGDPGPDGKPLDERDHVALAMAGSPPVHWWEDEREGDFFDAKGAVEALMDAMGIEGWALGGPAGEPFHPGRSASVEVAGETAGTVGELHPAVAERLGFPGRVAVAELDATVLAGHATSELVYRDVPRFPPVHRDLAFVVGEGAPAGAVRRAIREATEAAGLTASVQLFDVFTGEPVPAGRKSLAFSVDFRAPDRTLTDEEADRAVAGIVERLSADFAAELRAG